VVISHWSLGKRNKTIVFIYINDGPNDTNPGQFVDVMVN
jgi:hypothetical protein